ncbi:MAG: glycosyltransferase family 2 protein [Alphaproteobacteria bacterium]|nr:glycosyltransferase family 2 protein [Alphaproteobacteria bacterium]
MDLSSPHPFPHPSPRISVVVPMLNEAENAPALIEEILNAAQKCPIAEIVVVDDGSQDATPRVVVELRPLASSAVPHPVQIRVLRHSARAGQSAALRSGVRAAAMELVVTMDGDGQNNPADIPALYAAYMTRQTAPMVLVAGQRRKRQDSLLKKFTSRTGNFIRRTMLKDGVRDTGCSLKLFRRADYLALPYFNHMHRFLPALFAREYGDIILVDVDHRPRARGVSKYGFWDRLWAGIFDLIGVMWLQSRAAKKLTISEE